MAKFRATKGYHFSKDGTDATAWAVFTKVPGSDPVVYEYETSKAADVTALRKLIDAETAGYTDIVEVDDKPKRSRAKAGGAKSGDASGSDSGDGQSDTDHDDSGDEQQGSQ